MTSAAIAIQDLVVRAGRQPILSVPNLTLAPEELLAVMGPNGAGKTTLLRSCLGLQRPASGTITLLGHPLDTLGSLALTRLRRAIGYVPQLLPARSEMPLTVREVVAIGRTGLAGLFRPLRREDWRLVDEWMARLGMSALAGRAFREISGGEQRKTMIARAMVQQPRLLLLDEPTANLDLGWRERMVETIQALYEQTRVAVLLVCHELEVLPPGCRRAVLLEAGRIIAEGVPEQVFTTERVASLYGAGLSVIHQNNRHAVVPASARPRALTNERPIAGYD